jgi:thiol-disulfide isomerase/thioredoxin
MTPMKQLLVALMLLFSMQATAQNKAYDISQDPKGDGLIFNGPITFADLNGEHSFAWLKSGYDGYQPDKAGLAYLAGTLGDYTMVVFLGTWCDDSHELVPKLERVLDMTHYPATALTMYGVDRDKATKGGEHKRYDITLVPTIILYRNGKEAGRITESVQKSIEADLADIIQKDKSGGK